MFVKSTDEFPINIIRGDTVTFCIELCGAISSADILDVRMTVKKSPQSAVASVDIRLGRGIELLSETTDVLGVSTLRYKFTISHDDTKDLPVRAYYYDIEVKFVGDEHYTPLRGRFCLGYDITTD